MKKVASAGALAAMLFGSMLVGGCATEQPHALTGSEMAKYDPTIEEQRPYRDVRGRYDLARAQSEHPDWVDKH